LGEGFEEGDEEEEEEEEERGQQGQGPRALERLGGRGDHGGASRGSPGGAEGRDTDSGSDLGWAEGGRSASGQRAQSGSEGNDDGSEGEEERGATLAPLHGARGASKARGPSPPTSRPLRLPRVCGLSRCACVCALGSPAAPCCRCLCV
jgi:hypothetical protein